MAGALLITADSALGALVTDAMSGSGVDVAVARDGEDAVRALVRMQVDAVVGDALRPGDLDGARRAIESSGRELPLAVIAGESWRWNSRSLSPRPVQVFRRPVDLRGPRQALQLMVRGGGGERELALAPGVVLDCAADSVVCGDERVTLTDREMQILETLARAEGAVLRTEEMLRRVWATEMRNTDSLRTHVRSIRSKLASVGAPELIENLPRRGYRLRAEG